MANSRSRSPPGLEHGSPHPKHNWSKSSHRVHETSSSHNFSAESRPRSRKRSSAHNDIGNHAVDAEEALLRPSTSSCDPNGSRPKRVKTERRSLENARPRPVQRSLEENNGEARVLQDLDKFEKERRLQSIRVMIERKALPKTNNAPIKMDVENPEQIVIPRRPGEGSTPIFDREEIRAAWEIRTVTAISDEGTCRISDREKMKSSASSSGYETRTIVEIPDRRHHSPRGEGSSSKQEDLIRGKRRLEGRRDSRSHRNSTDSTDRRNYEKSSSRNYNEPSTSRYDEYSSSKTHHSSSRGHESRKAPSKREDDKYSESRYERDSSVKSYRSEKPDRRKSASPQSRISGHRSTPNKSEHANGHHESSSVQEQQHYDRPHETQIRPAPWPGGNYAPFASGPPVPFYPPRPVILTVPPLPPPPPRGPPRFPPGGHPRMIPRMQLPPRPDYIMYSVPHPRPPGPPFPGVPPNPRRRFR